MKRGREWVRKGRPELSNATNNTATGIYISARVLQNEQCYIKHMISALLLSPKHVNQPKYHMVKYLRGIAYAL